MPIVTGSDIASALGLPTTTAVLDEVATVADELLEPYLNPTAIAGPVIPTPVREAGIVLAIDIWQNRTAAGGQSVGIDGGYGPYRMGRSLIERIQGLCGPWMAIESEIG